MDFHMTSLTANVLDIVGVIILVVGMYLFISYYKLQQLRRKSVTNAAKLASNLDKRYALLTDLLACIKENGVEEKNAVSAVIKARATASRARSPHEHIALESAFTVSLLRLLVILNKKYPELKEDMWYVDIMAKFRRMNKAINEEGRAYNVLTRAFNDLVKAFPSKIMAKWMKYKTVPVYLSLEEAKLKLAGKDPIPEKELRKQEYAVQDELNRREREKRKAMRAARKKDSAADKEKKKRDKEHEKEVMAIMKERQELLEKEEQQRLAEKETRRKEKDIARRQKYEDERNK